MQKHKLYSILLIVASLAFLGGLVVLINSFGPDRLGNILLFYFLLSGLTFCLATLVGFYVRKVFGQREMLNHYFRIAARQAGWFILLLAISLFLLSRGWFSWINATLLILTLVFLESYLITKSQK